MSWLAVSRFGDRETASHLHCDGFNVELLPTTVASNLRISTVNQRSLEEGNPMNLQLTSTAFEEGQPIPLDHTGEGRNVSPQLKWTDPPAGTKSFALICEDPDAPRGTFTHWVVFNI